MVSNLFSGTVLMAGDPDSRLVVVLTEGVDESTAAEAVSAAASVGVELSVRAEAFGAPRSDPLSAFAIAVVVQELAVGVTASAIWSAITAATRAIVGRLSRRAEGKAEQRFHISITVLDARGSVTVDVEASGAGAVDKGMEGLREAVAAAIESRPEA